MKAVDIIGSTLLLVVVSLLHDVSGSCPCKDVTLCQPVKTPQRTPEVLGWNINPGTWRYYDWEKVTTIGVFRAWDSDADEMLCFAHSKNVRVVLPGNFPVANLTSESDRKLFVGGMLEKTISQHTDGVNFDIESPIGEASPERHALVLLINETRAALRLHNPLAQITADVAWSPEGIDGRYYDVKAMAEVTDFVAIMSYDERSQIFPPKPCIAMANSPLQQTVDAVGKYLALGISPEKLVLGQPWYGYNYPCEAFDNKTMVCKIAKVPFRGAPCSDAAGKEYSFSWIVRNMKASGAKRQWSTDQQAPFYNFVAADGKQHQIWYDDVVSLKMKYAHAKALKLRGLAFWTIDYLDYDGDEEGKRLVKEMWDAVL